MRHNFCTLFDRNYLAKGLVLHSSLLSNCRDFTLYILCMDDLTYQILGKMNLYRVVLISLLEFETPDLLRVKKERTIAEYSWTCTANLCRYILENKNIDEITYLDADMKFYSDPQIIFDEIGDKSVAIIEHRFSKARKYFEKTGKYNVSWVYFKNDNEGRRAVSWWSNEVIKWCYNRYENGKFGDQKYLDDWPTRFNNVVVIKTKGAGIAPWNIDNYQIMKINNNIFVDNQPLVFFHFHGFYFLERDKFIPAGNYYISKNLYNILYPPYFFDLKNVIESIKKIQSGFRVDFKKITISENYKLILSKIKILETVFLLYKKWTGN